MTLLPSFEMRKQTDFSSNSINKLIYPLLSPLIITSTIHGHPSQVLSLVPQRLHHRHDLLPLPRLPLRQQQDDPHGEGNPGRPETD